MASSYDDFLGSTSLVGFQWAPNNWALAQGQLLPLWQNTALFSLLGTYYGGNGTNNFALPDLRGRVPVGQGQGMGTSQRDLGDVYGQERVTLVAANLPAHEHPVQLGGTGSVDSGSGPAVQGTTAGTGGGLAPSGVVGNNEPVSTVPPTVVLNWIICLNGIFPSRSDW